MAQKKRILEIACVVTSCLAFQVLPVRLVRLAADGPARAGVLPAEHGAHVPGAAHLHAVLLHRGAAGDHPKGEHC